MANRHSLWIAHRLNIVLQTAYTWLDEDIYCYNYNNVFDVTFSIYCTSSISAFDQILGW